MVQNHLSQPQTTSHRFRLHLPLRDVCKYLGYFYEQEVSNRGCNLIVNSETTQAIIKTANLLVADDGKLGILYCGKCGNGKSTMLHAIAGMLDCLCERGKSKDMMTVLSARKIAELSTDNVIFSNICNQPLLGIDDLGTEAPEIVNFGNIIRPLTQLLEYRYDRQLYTIITTNLPPKDIGTIYGERVADRFRETITPIVFTSKSYR